MEARTIPRSSLSVSRSSTSGVPPSQPSAPDQSSANGVIVTVRVRPYIKEDYTRHAEGPERCIEMRTKQTLDITDQYNVPKNFAFDRTYWSHDPDHDLYATQATIYEELGRAMLSHATKGYNTCIFAYGQTGSGKTYSVLGQDTEEGRGLLPRIVKGLFEDFDNAPAGDKCTCLVSFMEIYNEHIYDLLAPAETAHTDLKIRSHPVLGAQVIGLTGQAVSSKEEVARFIACGTEHRTTGATAMNNASSRSHCIFTFKTTFQSADGSARISQTHLVDLAGSERANSTQSKGDRLKEGAAINQSLTTLARVISALAENSSKHGKSSKLPPFRDSKLTHILKEPLSGNSKTLMMAAISPSLSDHDETMSTLRFAQSVKKVQTSASVNEVCTTKEGRIEQRLRAELHRMHQMFAGEKLMRALDVVRIKKKEKELEQQEILFQCMGIKPAHSGHRQSSLYSDGHDDTTSCMSDDESSDGSIGKRCEAAKQKWTTIQDELASARAELDAEREAAADKTVGKAEAARVQDELREAWRQAAEAKTEVDVQAEARSAADEKLVYAESAVKSLAGELDAARSENKELGGRVDKAATDARVYAESAVESLSGELEAARIENKELGGRVDRAETDAKVYAESAMKNLAGELEVARSENKELDGRVDRAETDARAAAISSVDRLKGELATFTNEKTAALSRAAALSSEVADLGEAAAAANKTEAFIFQELGFESIRAQELQDELELVKDECAGASAKVHTSEMQLKEVKASASSEMAAADAHVDSLRDELAVALHKMGETDTLAKREAATEAAVVEELAQARAVDDELQSCLLQARAEIESCEMAFVEAASCRNSPEPAREEVAAAHGLAVAGMAATEELCAARFAELELQRCLEETRSEKSKATTRITILRAEAVARKELMRVEATNLRSELGAARLELEAAHGGAQAPAASSSAGSAGRPGNGTASMRAMASDLDVYLSMAHEQLIASETESRAAQGIIAQMDSALAGQRVGTVAADLPRSEFLVLDHDEVRALRTSFEETFRRMRSETLKLREELEEAQRALSRKHRKDQRQKWCVF